MSELTSGVRGEIEEFESQGFSQRRNLLKALLVAPVAVPVLSACTGTTASASGTDKAVLAATLGLISTNAAAVKPAVTEGPYYLEEDLVRSDIREDREGIPLVLQMQIVTADCEPIADARVDLWHCDAQGNYSGVSSMGSEDSDALLEETFLRGTQMTDANGIVTFTTVYPGWYQGRTTHMHYKVFLDEVTVLTSQIFLPDAMNEYIYLHHEDYVRDKQRDTVNSADSIAEAAGEGAYAAIREQSDSYIASMVVAVDPDSEWSESGQGMGGGPNGAPGGEPPADGERPSGPPPGGGGPGGPGSSGRADDAAMFPGGEPAVG